jgi:cyclin-dependent kinase 12/13
MSHEVVTPWYRCPELLLGTRHYGPEIDIWSIGCVFGEMMDGEHKPLFAGNGDVNQLELIYQTLGTPADDLLQRFRTLPNWDSMQSAIPRSYPNNFHRKFSSNPMYNTHSLHLLSGLIEMDPQKRVSAADALLVDYFYTDQPPEPQQLPKFQVESAFSMSEMERMQQEKKAADLERWKQNEDKMKARNDERGAREHPGGRGGFHGRGHGHGHGHPHGHGQGGRGNHHGRGGGQLDSKVMVVRPNRDKK